MWWGPNFQVCRICCPHQGQVPVSCGHSAWVNTDNTILKHIMALC
jgi:hypothetical protein